MDNNRTINAILQKRKEKDFPNGSVRKPTAVEEFERRNEGVDYERSDNRAAALFDFIRSWVNPSDFLIIMDLVNAPLFKCTTHDLGAEQVEEFMTAILDAMTNALALSEERARVEIERKVEEALGEKRESDKG